MANAATEKGKLLAYEEAGDDMIFMIDASKATGETYYSLSSMDIYRNDVQNSTLFNGV